MGHLPDGVVFIDGDCNLCHGYVRFIVRHETDPRLRFASLQSSLAVRFLDDKMPGGHRLDSVVLWEDGNIHTRSDAALRIARHLRAPWRFAGVFRIVPRGIRDAAYAFIAFRRHRWFGHRDECLVPDADLRNRFLDAATPGPDATDNPSRSPETLAAAR